MKLACGRAGTVEDRKLAWLLWANTVVEDAHVYRRRPSFPPPEEMDGDWVAMRKLSESRKKKKPAQVALMHDVGDWLVEQRTIEAENAAMLECLLFAAWFLWDLNGRAENAGSRTLYDVIANEWGIMPPTLESLPDDREQVFRMCKKWMREDDLVPNWYWYGRRIPRSERNDDAPAGVEKAEPPSTKDMFGGVD